MGLDASSLGSQISLYVITIDKQKEEVIVVWGKLREMFNGVEDTHCCGHAYTNVILH